MSYTIRKAGSLHLPRDHRRAKNIATFDDAAGSIGQQDSEYHELEPAEVVDVILTEDHPDYTSPEDIGSVKFRFIHSQYNRAEERLELAKPMYNNVSMYPVIHEIVLVIQVMNENYYMGVVNRQNNVNENSNPFSSIDLERVLEGERGSRVDRYEDAAAGVSRSRGREQSLEYGQVFEPDIRFKPLEHDEGDLILEGRFSNSIRFTSNQETGEPAIMIRNLQDPELDDLSRLSRVRENFNEDGSSIYLTEDIEVDITFATEELNMHLRSVRDFPDAFDTRQIIMNSDRFVLNAKEDQIYMFAADDIAFTTGNRFTVDSLRDMTMTTRANRFAEIDGFEINDIGEKVSWNVPKMYLGEDENEDNPLVLGQEYLELLTDILTFFRDNYIMITPVGPTDPGSVPSTPQINGLIGRIEDTLSERNFTM